MADRIPVILDTDIGSDIDDAVALSYLLRQPRCELVGITTVSGDVVQRAACAEVLCREAGRTDIPILAGLSDVLLYGQGQPHVPQYEAIKQRPHRLDYEKYAALHWLRTTIRQRPHQIVLLAIGPMTNISTLFAMDPELAKLLKGFVTMSGAFFGHGNHEWNVKVDPTAGAMLYNKAMHPGHISFGLDVTMQCNLPADEVRQRFTPKPLNVALEMAEVWFKQRPVITFHDPLAAASIFKPDLCTYATGRVNVPIDPDEKTCGKTFFTPDPAGPHKVADSVNTAAFFKEYFSVFQ